jgi:outer membrane protein TolC
MKQPVQARLLRKVTAVAGVALEVLLLVGCQGIPRQGKRWARQDLKRVGDAYRPQNERPALPPLQASASLSNFLQFAILNQPQVEAAYFDWAASVQRITVERSLPDPRLTFQTDIADMVMSLMPGLMMDFPGPGKLKAAANVATAESEGKYFAFEWSVVQTAFALKKAYYELHFLNAKVGVNREMLRLIGEIERLARTQNETGKVTLQDVLRAQIEQERITTEIANLEDSQNPLLAQFKAALGLKDEDAAPPVPRQFESTPLDLTSERLLAMALARNPRLKTMEAEVRRADASLRLAYKARVPDFTVGLEADAKASPVVYTPQVGVTLPIWRDKIAAQIAEARRENGRPKRGSPPSKSCWRSISRRSHSCSAKRAAISNCSETGFSPRRGSRSTWRRPGTRAAEWIFSAYQPDPQRRDSHGQGAAQYQ